MHWIRVGYDEWNMDQMMKLFQQKVKVIKLSHSAFVNGESSELSIKLETRKKKKTEIMSYYLGYHFQT